MCDDELVMLYQQTENKLVYGELYRRYFKKVQIYISQKLKDSNVSFDIAQEVFIKVMDKIKGLKVAATFVKWLFVIAYNDSMSYLKKISRIKIFTIDSSFEGRGLFIVENEINKKVNQIEEVLLTVPTVDQEMIIERYFEKKSVAELMEKYSISESAMKMRLLRTRKKLKQQIIELDMKQQLVA